MTPKLIPVLCCGVPAMPLIIIGGITAVVGFTVYKYSTSGDKENSNQTYQSNTKQSSNTQSGETQKNRQRSAEIIDAESSSFDQNEHPDLTSFGQRVRSDGNHIVDRILRCFRLGPLVQKISSDLNIPRENVLISGPSQFQDHISKLGPAFPAAHVIAMRINPALREYEDMECVNTLINFLGHTQNVQRFANSNIVGRRIDRMQGQYMNAIINIDYTGSLTERDSATITDILDSFTKMIFECLIQRNVEQEHVEVYIDALDILKTITAEEVFDRTKKACFEGGMDNYQYPRKRGRDPENAKRPKQS